MKDSLLSYSIGALLYCPANHKGIADSLIHEKFPVPFSLALCLEDTIKDTCVKEAEHILVQTLDKLHKSITNSVFFLPKIFIRVREPEQIPVLWGQLREARALVTGFIIPKFSLDQSDDYIREITEINKCSDETVYMMPIFESPCIINLKNRYDILYALKEQLDTIEDYVLNIRVGGNDLCHMFGFRRKSTESIHHIKPVADIFSDIITIFGMDYIISGPVWEYYSGSNWDSGLLNELNDDRLTGFIGKTVIHPNQIPLVNRAYKVSQKDYDDACSILNWDTSSHSLVSGSVAKERMNEYKTHSNWAEKILLLAETYGINNVQAEHFCKKKNLA